MIDELHPDAVRHAQERFTVVLPTDPEVKNWRENAEYLLVRGSYVTADDVKAARKLKAMGKQGVGIDKIDGEACEKAGVKIFKYVLPRLALRAAHGTTHAPNFI